MKYYFAMAFYFLLVGAQLHGQNYSLPTYADSVDWGEPLREIAVTKSGRIFLSSGIVNTTNGDQHIYVLNKERQLMHETSFRINTIQTDQPDSYFGCGSDGAWSFTNGYFTSDAMIVARHDSSGQIADAFLFNGRGTACGLANGGLLLTNTDSSTLIKLDTLGNIAWQFNISAPSGYRLMLEQSVEHPINKEITVMGVLIDQPAQDSSHLAILRLDSNGTLLWCKRYNTQGFEHMFQAVFNGELYLTYGYSSCGMLALDAGGQPLWSSTYFAPGSMSTWKNRVVEGYDGNVYFHVVNLNGPNNPNTFAANIGINRLTGAVVNAYWGPYSYFSYPQYGRDGRLVYGYPVLYLVNDIAQVNCMSHSPVAVNYAPQALPVAYSHTAGQMISNAVKIPAAFINTGPVSNVFYHQTLCENLLQANEISEPDRNIKIFTAVDELHIEMENCSAINSGYKMFDMSGREILTGNITSELTTINCAGLSEGCYVVHVYNQDGGQKTMKVMLYRGR
jgi:hypothetical protein